MGKRANWRCWESLKPESKASWEGEREVAGRCGEWLGDRLASELGKERVGKEVNSFESIAELLVTPNYIYTKNISLTIRLTEFE